MELEDLVLKRFRVERKEQEIIVTPDEQGSYQATSAEDVAKALTNRYPPQGVYVLQGETWYPIRRGRR